MNNIFQSTFPRGERRSSPEYSYITSYFNPRSRVGNDISFSCACVVFICISIHVPAWGTTAMLLEDRILETISIHVPAWGTTRLNLRGKSSHLYFNPRSRVGNDCKFSQIFFAFLCNKYNFSTFYYPFSLFFGVIHFTFLIFAVRILPIFYVYF